MVFRVRERNGACFLVHIPPETFALGVYSLVWSILVSNCLWIYILIVCCTLATSSLEFILNQMIIIHMAYGSVTTFLWWLISKERGRAFMTHLLFYIWFGGKMIASAVEIYFFPLIYSKIMLQTPGDEVRMVMHKASCGVALVSLIELGGLFFAHKYLLGRQNKRLLRSFKVPPKLYPTTTLQV